MLFLKDNNNHFALNFLYLWHSESKKWLKKFSVGNFWFIDKVKYGKINLTFPNIFVGHPAVVTCGFWLRQKLIIQCEKSSRTVLSRKGDKRFEFKS